MVSAPHVFPAVVLDRTQVDDGLVRALVLRCGGEIDSFNAHQLAAAVSDGLTRVPDRLVVVDMRDVTFLGASAITALVEGAAATPTGTTDLRLVVGDCRPVLLVIRALDLHSTFSIHHDLEDALRR
jgi:anti-sigma B factor antagonist